MALWINPKLKLGSRVHGESTELDLLGRLNAGPCLVTVSTFFGYMICRDSARSMRIGTKLMHTPLVNI